MTTDARTPTSRQRASRAYRARRRAVGDRQVIVWMTPASYARWVKILRDKMMTAEDYLRELIEKG